MRLNWIDNSNDESGFEVADCVPPLNSADCILDVRTGPNTTTYTWSGTAGAYKCFSLRAWNDAGYSSWSPSYVCGSVPSEPTLFNVAIPASSPWTDTGIMIKAGQNVSISASGTIFIAGSDNGKSPDGGGGATCGLSGTVPSAACWSLIGRVGSGPVFAVGSTYDGTPGAGTLYLGVNDDVFGDNSSSWYATVIVE